MITLLITVCVVISAWLLCFLVSNPSSKLYVEDKPTARSLHTIPKPCTGGIAIFTSIFIAWLIISFTHNVERFNYYLAGGLGILFVISYLDDRYSMPQIWRLFIHIVAAILLVFSGVGLSMMDIHIEKFIDNSFTFNILTILIIVWCVNLYNFMDGMDGLAGGMGVIGFACLAWFGWFAGNNLFMLMASIVVAANLGFLLHNFPPAKIFMGDVGSITMGYLFAFFSLWGIQENIFVWWVPILIFSPFIADATLTLIKRLFTGGKIWEAHRSHYFQKLVLAGWGHKKTAIYEYILMIAAACSAAVIGILESNLIAIFMLLAWLLIYLMIVLYIDFINVSKGKNH